MNPRRRPIGAAALLCAALLGGCARMVGPPVTSAAHAACGIGPGAARAFAEKLRSLPPGERVEVVADSCGGSLEEALEMARTVASLPQGADTVVPAGGRCNSACTVVFLAGRRRSMGEGAVLGFHGVSRTMQYDVWFHPPFDRLLGGFSVPLWERFDGRDPRLSGWIAARAPALAASLEERGAFDRPELTEIGPDEAARLGATTEGAPAAACAGT